MDPYLESPALWPDVHHGLITAIQESLNEILRPRYVCRVEERVYVAPDPYPSLAKVRFPDVNVSHTPALAGSPTAQGLGWPQGEEYRLLEVEEVAAPPLREAYLVIRRPNGDRVITVIEVLSPANKAQGTDAHQEYAQKRHELLRSEAHLVEIDLLRAGKRPVLVPAQSRSFYAVYLNTVHDRSRTQVLMWPLPKPLPQVPIPLATPDPPAQLDLQQALILAYKRGAYDLSIDYGQPAVPPLAGAEAEWADGLLADRRGGAGKQE